MWINTYKFSDNNFSGILLDSPILVKNWSLGDTIIVHKDEIEDWIFYDNNRKEQHGNYTDKFIKPKN